MSESAGDFGSTDSGAGNPSAGNPGAGNSGPRSDAAAARAAADTALMLAIAAQRDRAAFVMLFDRFAPRLKSWFLRGGTSPSHAEDLVQETMLTVWRKAEHFDPGRAAVATWIFTIARNQRIDQLRRSARQVLDEDDPSLAPAEPARPDAAFDAAQRETKLRAALATLTADQVEVVRLSFFEDRPHAEIERVLGIPLGTVKSRLRLAMNRLRAHLGEYQSGNPGSGKSGPGKPDASPHGEQS